MIYRTVDSILDLVYLQLVTSDEIRHEAGWCAMQEPCGYNGYLDGDPTKRGYIINTIIITRLLDHSFEVFQYRDPTFRLAL